MCNGKIACDSIVMTNSTQPTLGPTFLAGDYSIYVSDSRNSSGRYIGDSSGPSAG